MMERSRCDHQIERFGTTNLAAVTLDLTVKTSEHSGDLCVEWNRVERGLKTLEDFLATCAFGCSLCCMWPSRQFSESDGRNGNLFRK